MQSINTGVQVSVGKGAVYDYDVIGSMQRVACSCKVSKISELRLVAFVCRVLVRI